MWKENYFVKDDDLIVSQRIEVTLAVQLGDHADELGIDQCYFEHHCFLGE